MENFFSYLYLIDRFLLAELFMYPTGHAFTNKERPEVHHPESRALAFKRTFDYFNEVLA